MWIWETRETRKALTLLPYKIYLWRSRVQMARTLYFTTYHPSCVVAVLTGSGV